MIAGAGCHFLANMFNKRGLLKTRHIIRAVYKSRFFLFPGFTRSPRITQNNTQLTGERRNISSLEKMKNITTIYYHGIQTGIPGIIKGAKIRLFY